MEGKVKKITFKKIIIILIVPVTIAAGIFIYTSEKQYEWGGGSVSGYIIGDGIEPNLTPEEIQALLNKQVDESKIAFSIYSEPTFQGKKGTIMFANPRYSAHNIDLTVTLDGKEIIKTGKIAPNQYIEEISLLGKPLKEGKHKAMGVIKAYDKKTDKVVGEVAVDLIITSK